MGYSAVKQFMFLTSQHLEHGVRGADHARLVFHHERLEDREPLNSFETIESLSHLVIEEGLGLFNIPKEQMKNVCLDQNLSPALPHLQQFVPAHIELLEPLLQGSLGEGSLLRLQ